MISPSMVRFLWRERLIWFLREPPVWEFSTRIYEGQPGSGKTLAMVRDAVELMRHGVVVYSNLQIVDRVSGQRSRPMDSWLGMLRATVDCLESGDRVVFAIDEIHLMCDARNWQLTPGWWLNLMAQRRHYGIGVLGTTQDVSTVEKRLRQLVGLLVRMRRLVRLPTWLPGARVLNRLAWFRFQEIDGRTISDATPTGATVGAGYISWMPWYAFGGYDTRALMSSDDFAGYTDEAAAAEVAELTARARAICGERWEPAVFAEIFDSVEGVAT